jgi:arylsulfatase
MKPKLILIPLTLVIGASFLMTTASAQSPAPSSSKQPNILIIWGDDIGWFNPSCYHHGIMGYQTPNIDRIAKEGARFTDWYGQQSCTAGRAAFIMGQSPIRTGMTKVGLPGATLGIQPQDPTIAELLKPHGYVSGQFGKNHLGDRNEFLPTVHGFDEFFGNLYHLNAEEEPENPDYPKDPDFKKKYGPRGVLHSWATNTDDTTVDSQFGKVGKQKIENTGPMNLKRMETVDEEFLDGALKFIDKAHADNKPFFCWFNSTRTSSRTSSPNPRARLASVFMPTAWSNTTAWSDSCLRNSTSSASRTTRSSCGPPTMALK